MLNEKEVKRAVPQERTYLLRDDKGLYLKVDTAGRKYWLLRYWESGRERQLSLGVYPDVSLNEARKKRDELHAARARVELISVRPDKIPVNFLEAAEQWLKVRMKGKAANYMKSIHLRLGKYILPSIGNLKLSEIKSPTVLALCRKIGSVMKWFLRKNYLRVLNQ